MSKTYKEAEKRIPTQRDRILESLRSAGKDGILNTELHKITLRWQARLHELYQQGFKVDVSLVGDGVYRYTLLSEPEVVSKPRKAMDLFFEKAKESYGDNMTLEQMRGLLSEEGFNIVRKCGSYK